MHDRPAMTTDRKMQFWVKHGKLIPKWITAWSDHMAKMWLCQDLLGVFPHTVKNGLTKKPLTKVVRVVSVNRKKWAYKKPLTKC